ncbi:hypothetical protein G5S35_01100 [Paraburkholderia tropica]|uniref:hypothetical protein n=1 Tax=Paraburkholderia tropica TaxID=92647 RepID=UPI0016033AE7|nr:hypothetical protein [Paraburkholderia tropica]QNB10296.1 hypothetical protein G5S35_01100 [Paraburkholderia tropica]
MGLTDYLAIYGAVLSSAVAGWNYLRTRSNVRVKLVVAVETVDGTTKGGVGISIQNPSAQTAHITNVSFLYPYTAPTLSDYVQHMIQFRQFPTRLGWCNSDLALHGIEDGCPISIESGKSHWIFVNEDTIDALLKKAKSRRLKAVVQDALWRNKYSSVFECSARPKDMT